MNIMVSAWRSCIKPLVGSNCVGREMVDGVDGSEGGTPEKSLRASVESSVPRRLLTGIVGPTLLLDVITWMRG